MTTSVTLPALGESVTEGTITRWLKQVGEDVAADEPLVEVSTDKVDTEIPSPASGTLLEIKVSEDETVEVGAELAIIGAAQVADQPAVPEPKAQAAAPAAPAAVVAPSPTEPAIPPSPAVDDSTAGYVTPLVRKLAAQHDVELDGVVGSGVAGRLRRQDVLDAARAKSKAEETPPAAASVAPPTPPPSPSAAKPATASAVISPTPLRGRTEPMTRLRKVIAQRMIESLQTSAQLTQVVEVDVTAISRLRDSIKADFATREGVKLSYFPFFAKAALDAIKLHASLNATIDMDKGEVTYHDVEHLAIAVDTPRGLLSPVIKGAGDLSVAGLARKIADVADRTRNNKITPDELSGGTFTLTNTGSVGALIDTPIINQPQVAILGTGTVVKRPVVIDDANLGETIAIRQMCFLSLTYDHRLVDGADAGRFLQDVKHRLEASQFDV